jgi:hypothetical protein
MTKNNTPTKEPKKETRGRPPSRVIPHIPVSPEDLARMVGANKFSPKVKPRRD